VGRYFIFVGSILLAMLFVMDWYWPAASPMPEPVASVPSPFEQTIRIHSARRWPQKVVIDTNMPVPQAAPLVATAQLEKPTNPTIAAANPPAVSPLDGPAEIKPSVRPASPLKRQARLRHHDNPRPDYWRRPNTFASAGPPVPFWPFGR